MEEMYKRLGISRDANPEKIKQAYKRRALENHPDKPGGSHENMQKLNEAYRLLNNPEELEKYLTEHSDNSAPSTDNFLNFNGERPSESYRRFLQSLVKMHTKLPAESFALLTHKEAFTELNTPFMHGLLPEEYYRNLYRIKEDGLECEDIFQYVAHKTKWSTAEVNLSVSFFKEPLTIKKGISILNDFLEGKYYGTNLETIQNYILFQVTKLKAITYDVVVYNALLTIISSKSLADDHKSILNAVEQIYKYIYQTRSMEKPEILALIQSKYFRYFIASALKHNWQDSSFSGPQEILQDLKSNFDYLARMSPMHKAHASIEKKLQSVFSKKPMIDEAYECGYLISDMMVCGGSSESFTNYAFIAALCFHYASTLEIEPAKTIAAEYIALTLYQSALERGFNTNVMLGFYIANQAIKSLGALKYDQSTFDIDNISALLVNPGDAALFNYSGSVTSSMRGAIKKALYAVDLAPFYSSAQSTSDLEILSIFQHGMLCASLNNILAREKITDFKYSKVAYHAYELALHGWYTEKKKGNRVEKTSELKMKAMEALLEDAGSNLFDVSTLVGPGFSHMKRDWRGFLEPTNELHFPEKAGIQRFSTFKGFKFDRKKKTIDFITETVEVKDPTTGEMAPQILFTSQDIAQMIKKEITGVEFSLDAPGPEPLNPLQKVFVRPENVRGTGYYETLFMADYLLKMFTTGAEVSGLPPYLTKENTQLIERLPPELRDVLGLLRNTPNRGPKAHRFWITTKKDGSIDWEKIVKLNSAINYKEK